MVDRFLIETRCLNSQGSEQHEQQAKSGGAMTFHGTDKLTQGPGLALHKFSPLVRKRVIWHHIEAYPLGFGACDSHFTSKNKLTCQYPKEAAGEEGSSDAAVRQMQYLTAACWPPDSRLRVVTHTHGMVGKCK